MGPPLQGGPCQVHRARTLAHSSLDSASESLYEGGRRRVDMRTWHLTVTAVVAAMGIGAVTMTAQQRAESHDMTLLGSNDLQARSSYQPVIQKQGDRYIAYI